LFNFLVEGLDGNGNFVWLRAAAGNQGRNRIGGNFKIQHRPVARVRPPARQSVAIVGIALKVPVPSFFPTHVRAISRPLITTGSTVTPFFS